MVFARFPEPGAVKTRMIPALGAEGAKKLHAALTQRTLETARQLSKQVPCDVDVRVAGGAPNAMRDLFGPACSYVAQVGADLGERLEAAVRESFAEGVERVLVVGTDCPDLDSSLLQEAFHALHEADLVLGPAVDGGYYLIGLRTLQPELFRNIAWGSESVLNQTLAVARKLKLKVHRLRPLSDIDYAEDLLVCRRAELSVPGVLPSTQPGLISIVIPTLNEEGNLADALQQLAGKPGIEVLIADGGSRDRTVEIAEQHGVRVVRTRPGRGRQMNAGAALASGEILLFLHADSGLPKDFAHQVRQILDQGASGGAFPLRIESQRRGLRCVEWGANLRSRLRQLPYGDQGLFLQASLFHEMGGFPPMPLMEDFEFCRRLRRYGTIRLASSAITTSPRRWHRLGIVRTTLINQLCIAGYLLGIKPERLAKWYAGRRQNPPHGSR